jgi:ribosome-associated protein
MRVLPEEDTTISPLQKAHSLAQALLDKKAQDVVLLDVTQLVDYVDGFLIATATSQPHLDALTDAVTRSAQELEMRVLGVEGRGTKSWILIDIGDVLVHLFSGEARGFYDLDGLWCDAARTEFSPEESPEESATG